MDRPMIILTELRRRLHYNLRILGNIVSFCDDYRAYVGNKSVA